MNCEPGIQACSQPVFLAGAWKFWGTRNSGREFLGDAKLTTFLPRDASAERGDATVNRPSVRNV